MRPLSLWNAIRSLESPGGVFMIRFFGRLVALTLPLLIVGLAEAQESGFHALFNGTDLTGWRYGKEILHRQTETPDGRFSVTGGTIVLARKDKEMKSPVKELITFREFTKDFNLKVEFKATQESIGAVTVRNYPFPVGDFLRRGEHKHLKNFKTDGWNELEVTIKMAAYADGRRLTESDQLEAGFQNGKAVAKVNGKSVDPNRVIIQIEGSPKINGEVLGGYAGVPLPSKGPVGLRSNSGKIEFRNIRFREIP
jgi:hypothetical protein